ncbi:hypothetical protein BHE74_00025644 [Ensete ventricosum]|uniref:Translation initiation factor eIF2B subunit alpha n=1 Tax=Ensete ventricosum TaxID=4639 RepID=A0A426ZLR1_ENSVE|nr:hypothetical protein B296_00020342 [Ensete ventricosum]RWW66950.1 hypothetical protein BHE74_00025644 [Ensete ventricosum]
MDPNPKPNHGISAYYQTRAEHHAIISGDWLAQAQAATAAGHPLEVPPASATALSVASKPFSIIDEFNHWRRKPDLAEAVAAIMALVAGIRSSDATTMMELEIELKKASDALKFARLYPLDQKDLEPALRPVEFGVPIPSGVEIEKSARDYTPPHYLTLLFTDLGVLTPSVVSDELIQLYL